VSGLLGDMSPWTFGWEALVAIGTIGLASGTFWLARTTRSLAKLTRMEIEGTIRPLLVNDLRDYGGDINVNFQPVHAGGLAQDLYERAKSGAIVERREDQNTVYVGIPLRNVGPGTAVLTIPHPSIQPRGGSAHLGKVNALAIPPGGTAYALFVSGSAGAHDGFDPARGNYRVQVAYRDAAGGQPTRTELYVDPLRRVGGIALFRGGDPTPFLHYGETWEDWPAPELTRWPKFRRWLRQLPRLRLVRP